MAASAPATGNVTVTGAPPGAEGRETRVMVMGGGGGAGGPPPIGNNTNFVSASELPDYKPPFFAGSTRADGDGFLWIRTIPTRAIAGGPVYDVVNSKGELVERVQVPKGRSIVGFGPDGVVYLLALEGEGTPGRLERARVR
jgi:hypothetical protein